MFGFGKKYPDRSDLYFGHLFNDLEMEMWTAKYFIVHYGKKVSKYHYNINNHVSSVLDHVIEESTASSLVSKYGIKKFCITVVAHEAYIKDLKGRGKHIGTSVERAIVGILLKNADFLKTYDPGLCKFILENKDRKWPGLEETAFKDYSQECLSIRLGQKYNE